MQHRLPVRKVGLSPGSVVYTGDVREGPARLMTMSYSPDELVEDGSARLDDVARGDDARQVLWLNVDGLHETDVLTEVGARFGIHQLALEDIANVGGRPQFTDYDDSLFLSLKMLSFGAEGGVQTEHLSLVLGEDFVLSFQEREGDVFDGVRRRLREGRTRIRSRGADYLWYALIDAVVDNYILVMDGLAERTEDLEEQVWDGAVEREIPGLVQGLRSEMLTVRRALRPLREQIDTLYNTPPEQISAETAPYLADLRDHLLQLADTQEGMKDGLSSVMDVHFSILSTRMNEVMKVLTIVASIFVPITFIAGVYGMNFQHMPELTVPWAYPAAWVTMMAVALGMLAYFRHKGWL